MGPSRHLQWVNLTAIDMRWQGVDCGPARRCIYREWPLPASRLGSELNCARVGIRLLDHWHRGPGQTIWANQLSQHLSWRGLYSGRDPRGTGDPLLASAALASSTAANSQLLKALQSVRPAV